jgi:hypothetical protein
MFGSVKRGLKIMSCTIMCSVLTTKDRNLGMTSSGELNNGEIASGWRQFSCKAFWFRHDSNAEKLLNVNWFIARDIKERKISFMKIIQLMQHFGFATRAERVSDRDNQKHDQCKVH